MYLRAIGSPLGKRGRGHGMSRVLDECSQGFCPGPGSWTDWPNDRSRAVGNVGISAGAVVCPLAGPLKQGRLSSVRHGRDVIQSVCVYREQVRRNGREDNEPSSPLIAGKTGPCRLPEPPAVKVHAFRCARDSIANEERPCGCRVARDEVGRDESKATRGRLHLSMQHPAAFPWASALSTLTMT